MWTNKIKLRRIVGAQVSLGGSMFCWRRCWEYLLLLLLLLPFAVVAALLLPNTVCKAALKPRLAACLVDRY